MKKTFFFIFLHAPYMSIVGMIKKYFLLFLNVFHCFRPCKRMCKHALGGRNTQQREAVKYHSDWRCVKFKWPFVLNFVRWRVMLK